MANHALAALESALRARKLDRTLTTALAPLERIGSVGAGADGCRAARCVSAWRPSARAAVGTGRPALVGADDAAAADDGGGHARAARSRRSSTRSIGSMWHRRLRPASICRGCCGSAVRTIAGSGPGSASARPIASIDRALKALNLVLQAGGFGVVAIDLADVPPAALRQIPVHDLAARAARDRRQRHRVRAGASEPLARSAGGLTVSLAGRADVGRDIRSQPSSVGHRRARRAWSRRASASMEKRPSARTADATDRDLPIARQSR